MDIPIPDPAKEELKRKKKEEVTAPYSFYYWQPLWFTLTALLLNLCLHSSLYLFDYLRQIMAIYLHRKLPRRVRKMKRRTRTATKVNKSFNSNDSRKLKLKMQRHRFISLLENSPNTPIILSDVICNLTTRWHCDYLCFMAKIL